MCCNPAADHDRKSKVLKDQVLTTAQNVKDGYHPRKLFELLLNTAQLEYILSQVRVKHQAISSVDQVVSSVDQIISSIDQVISSVKC